MFREFLDRNPLVALTGIVVATVASTFAVLSHFKSQEIAMLNSRHEELVSQLRSQINSINRGVSDDGATKFNVRKAMITDTEALRLDKKFSSFLNGAFYLDTPVRGAWNHVSKDELSAALFALDDSCLEGKDVPAEVTAKLGTVEIWHQKSGDSARLTIPEASPLRRTCEHLRLFSYIEVRLVDHDWIRKNTSFFTIRPGQDATSEELLSFIRDPKSSFEDLVKEDVEFGGYLPGDLAAPLLLQHLMEQMLLATAFSGASGRVLAVEKAQNALYVHTRAAIPNSTEGSDAGAPYSYDQEMFIIGSGTKALLIKVFLLHSDRQKFSDDYAWTQGWLAGLRVVAQQP